MAAQMAAEGANVLQLQPGLFSLDLVKELKSRLSLPVALYSVSGEYQMLRSLGPDERSFFDVLIEHATASIRCGADYLVTYAWDEILSGKQQFV